MPTSYTTKINMRQYNNLDHTQQNLILTAQRVFVSTSELSQDDQCPKQHVIVAMIMCKLTPLVHIVLQATDYCSHKCRHPHNNIIIITTHSKSRYIIGH